MKIPSIAKIGALTALAFVAGWSASRIVSPEAAKADANRVFELRVYHANSGKLGDLQKLFHDHPLPMFKKHGMTNVGYWIPQDQPDHDNTWIYIIAHPSREDAKKNWAAFQADPEWQAGFKAASANGPLVSKIDSTFMDPAEISPIK